ncbi:MAG: hypothetical protein L0Y61_09255, partial [Epsilonproteobacteria bacterium]|nr:hypothetical protein [Campylobacterota bacterium]
MPFNKKFIVYFCVLILFFTCFSGCIIFENIFGAASFSLDSYSFVDDAGFPAIYVSFYCSGRANLKTFDSSSNMVD